MLLAGSAISEADIRFGVPWTVDGLAIIPVEIDTESPLSAIELQLGAEWIPEGRIEGVGPVNQWERFVELEQDTLRLLLLDSELGSPLPAGKSTVLTISVDLNALDGSDRRISMQAAEFGTSGTPPSLVSPVIQGSMVSIPRSYVNIESAHAEQGESTRFELRLHLEVPAAGIQFDVTLDPPPKGSFGIPELGLPEDVGVFSNQIEEGVFRILATDLRGEKRIPPGITRMVFPFKLSRIAQPGPVRIAIQAAVARMEDDAERTLLGGLSEMEVLVRPNTAPVLPPNLPIHILEDSVFSWQPPVLDYEGDPVSILMTEGPDWLSLERGRLTGTPSEDAVGTWEVRLAFSDSVLTSDGQVTISVQNRPPSLQAAADVVTRTGKTAEIDLEVDYCGDCAFHVSGLPGASIDGTRLTWLAERMGDYPVSVVATDGFGKTDRISFTLRVLDRPKIVIEEILADPPDGEKGDANGNGSREGYADEFVEIVNRDSRVVDISSWTLSDDDTAAGKRFAFPPGTVLRPGDRAVLFGGGSTDPEGLLFSDDGRIGNGLTNRGDGVLLLDPVCGDTIDAAWFEAVSGFSGSYIRSTDGLSPHSAFPGHELMSPGSPRALFAYLKIDFPHTIFAGIATPISATAAYSDEFEKDVTDQVAWVTSHRTIRVDEARVTSAHAGRFALSVRWHSYRKDIQITVEDQTPEVAAPLEITAPDTVWRVGVPFCYRPLAVSETHLVTLSSDLTGFPSSRDSVCWTPILSEAGSLRVSIRSPGAESKRSYPLVIRPRPRVQISEVLTRPPNGSLGDANGDGHRDDFEDEFIEIRNVGLDSADISGWVLTDDDTNEERAFRFPSGTLLTQGAFAVLFGGGAPGMGSPLAFADDGKIGNGLANGFERLLLVDPAYSDTIDVAEVDGPASGSSSMVRTDSGWVPHDLFFQGQAFSPGRPGRIAEPPEPIELPIPLITPRIRISEVLASPGPGLDGDANRDGTRHPYEDEFIELVNQDTVAADLSGWSIEIGKSRFHFPSGTLVLPSNWCVVFGGGDPRDIPGTVIVSNGRIGRGLPNGGAEIRVFDALGGLVDSVSYGPSQEGVSLVYSENDGQLHSDLPSRGLYSPGRRSPRLIEFSVTIPDSALVVGQQVSFSGFGRFDDGNIDDVTERLAFTQVDGHTRREDERSLRAVLPGYGRLTFELPGLPAYVLWVRILESSAEPTSNSDEKGEARDMSVSLQSLPDVLTVLSGIPFQIDLGSTLGVRIASGENWIGLGADVITGTPRAAGEFDFSVISESGDTASVTIRVITAEQILDRAPGVARAGVTWVWPIPSSYGLEVQAGNRGRFDPHRNALVWRPGPDETGEQAVEIAINSPGSPSTVLRKVIVIGQRPDLRVTGIVVSANADTNKDGKVDEEDVFVEIRNDDAESIDLAGWTIGDDDAAAFAFPEGFHLEPGKSVRVHARADDSSELAADGQLGNGVASTDRILLIAPAGPDTVIDLIYRSRGQSGLLRPDPADPGSWMPEAALEGELQTVPLDVTSGRIPAHSFRIRPCPARSCVDIGMNVVFGHAASVLVLNELGQVVDRLFEGYLVEGDHVWRWCPEVLRISSGVYLIIDTQDQSAGVGRAVIVH